MIEGSERIELASQTRLRKALDAARWYKRLRDPWDRRQASNALAVLLRTDGGSSADLTAYRDRGLTHILAYAYKHCPYYKAIFNDAGLDPKTHSGFDKLPCLDKTTVRQHMPELMPDCIRYVNHVMKKTGGSTGEPMEFPLATSNRYMDYAHYEFAYRLMGWQPGDPIATFGGRVVPAKIREQNIFWLDMERDLPDGRRHYSALYLNPETMPFYVREILETKPAILRGHPSFINEIAEYILEHDITLPFRVKGVQFTAEMCFQWQADNIRNAFSTTLYPQYGHSEGAVFAFTRRGSCDYYCSPFFGMTEVLNSEGKHVQVGEVGDVVVTGFHNLALPFIRYRTGDLAVYGGEKTGVVVLAEIQGRDQDYLIASDGRKNAITTLLHLKAFSNMSGWQIVQNEIGKITVLVVKERGFSTEDGNEIQTIFRQHFGVEAVIRFVDSIPRTAAGKVKLFVQNIKCGG